MKRDFDSSAKASIDFINKGIKASKLLETILTSLVELSSESSVKNVIDVKMDEERAIHVFNKTHFEILCFASYWTSSLISRYAVSNSLFGKKVDIEGAQYFYKCIHQYLNEICELHNFGKFNDIGFINSSGIIGPTEKLSSDKRLLQYEKLATDRSNSDTLQLYAKHLAMTYALGDYAAFEPLTLTFVEPTIKIAEITMRGVFT
jgi:hypothetical protein